jgi:hypothetical protein
MSSARAYRLLFLRCPERASGHFEAGQKLDVALIASNTALADAGFLLWRVKLRPAFRQLVLGFCFVFRASKKAVDASASVDTWIAQISQMSLEELATFQSKTLAEITAGKVTPKQARTIDRSIGERLNVIEQHLRCA